MAKISRTETDSMGQVEVPVDAYYGAQTARALVNFQLSSLRLPRRFIAALGLVKAAAARANISLGLLDLRRGQAIEQAAREVADGRFDDAFVVDVFQTGSGTSTNMNANEVIANRAAELLGGARGEKSVVHPNDHVNMGQSTNDVFPTALHVAALLALETHLLPALRRLAEALERRRGSLPTSSKLPVRISRMPSRLRSDRNSAGMRVSSVMASHASSIRARTSPSSPSAVRRPAPA